MPGEPASRGGAFVKRKPGGGGGSNRHSASSKGWGDEHAAGRVAQHDVDLAGLGRDQGAGQVGVEPDLAGPAAVGLHHLVQLGREQPVELALGEVGELRVGDPGQEERQGRDGQGPGQGDARAERERPGLDAQEVSSPNQ